MNASVQKLFTATAVLQLVEKGLLDLDEALGDYLPFTIRHPEYPEVSITARMLLAHRSGLGEILHQFAWDTESTFSPRYRPPCPGPLLAMSQEELLIASLTPEGENYDPGIWRSPPDRGYGYSVSAFPLLRYLVSKVAGQSYDDYLRENVFIPLGMNSSGFSVGEFAERHALPYTRIDGENIELPLWDGRGSMMHTTAGDMAAFVLALLRGEGGDEPRVLEAETVVLLRERTSCFKYLFKSHDDMSRVGQCLGISALRGGWFGIGGSAPGYQCLLRFHPTRQIGFVILTNVNAILGGGDNYRSARGEIYSVQNALLSVLDPSYPLRRRAAELGIVGVLVLYSLGMGLWARRRASKRAK